MVENLKILDRINKWLDTAEGKISVLTYSNRNYPKWNWDIKGQFKKFREQHQELEPLKAAQS